MITILELLILNSFALSIFDRIPHANGIFAFTCMGLLALILIRLMTSRTLRYFKSPRVTKVSILAIFIALWLVVPSIAFVEDERKPFLVALIGIVHLFAIGFGEETLARGFLFGSLERFGVVPALIISSSMFGIMHLNAYRGARWDPWSAYWHVMSAFSFGIFICALMIVTGSIWTAVVFHALSDWFLVFGISPYRQTKVDPAMVDFWDGILNPVDRLLLHGFLAALILFLDGQVSLPRHMRRLLVWLKLVSDA